MRPIVGKAEAVLIRAFTRDEVDRKRVQKYEHHTRDIDTIKHIEKKLIDKGVLRMARHSGDGLPLRKQSKSGHGGKYTWEGPVSEVENKLDVVPAAIDEKDPNYVDDEEEDNGLDELVVCEVGVW